MAACSHPVEGSTPTADVASTLDAFASDAAQRPADHGSTSIVHRTIEAGGRLFDARVAGPDDGQAVVLLHGFPQTSFEWRAQMTALAEDGYRVIAPNQRGYSPGARPQMITDYAVELLAQDIIDIADAQGAAMFHLVGHDWGAAVAWVVAARAPERVSTLTAISIPHVDALAEALADSSSCQHQASGYMDAFAMPGAEQVFLADDAMLLEGLYDGLAQEAVDDYLSVLGTPEALGAALNWYRANISNRTLTTPPAGPVAVDTLYIWSDGDSAVCQQTALATAEYVTGPYRFEVIAGVDHWVPEKAADAVNVLLLEHLAEP